MAADEMCQRGEEAGLGGCCAGNMGTWENFGHDKVLRVFGDRANIAIARGR